MPKIVNKTFQIDGMTCGQCEKIIQKKLIKEEGIVSTEISYSKGTATIVYDLEKISEERIHKIVQDAGYDFKTINHSNNVKPSIKTFQWAGIGVVLAAFILLIQLTIGFNFIPELSVQMSYGMLFVVGLLTSVHCIAMCGGINLSQCLVPRENGTFTADWRPSFQYNLGRVLSYTIIGGIVGGLGSVIQFTGSARGLIAILAGLFMMIMGINMLGIFPFLRKVQVRLPSGLRQKLLGKNKSRGPLVIGILNGLMPCGPLQAMQLYALGSGSVLSGALSMLFFSLGTVPLMFGFGLLSTYMSKNFTKNLLKLSGLLVALLGIIMMGRGFNLSGLGLPSMASLQEVVQSSNALKSDSPSAIAKVENGVQVVTGEIQSRAYPNMVVKKGIPLRINFHAEESQINGCNGTLVIPDYGIQLDLKPGDNYVEFTPSASGKLVYTCWMGMVSGEIDVVEELEQK